MRRVATAIIVAALAGFAGTAHAGKDLDAIKARRSWVQARQAWGQFLRALLQALAVWAM